MRFIPLLWLGFVTAISLMPLRLKYRAGTTGILHNPGHFLIFFITAILLCRTAPHGGSRLLRWIGICCFATLMEVLEWTVYHNRLEWRDMLVDFFGAAFGLFALNWFSERTAVRDVELSSGRDRL